MSDARAAALAFARRGWPVLPCQPGRKEPATCHGVLDAETSPAVISRWWARHPDANVAVATGAPGPTVLDVDVAHGKPGRQSLRQVALAGLVPPAWATVRTPSGGRHLYYAGDDQGNASMPALGLDLRGRGGYVLVPPSTVGGTQYVVVGSSRGTPARIDFTAIRACLAPQPQRLPAPGFRSRDPGAGHLAGWVAQLPEGNRNSGLFWAACRAAEAGDDRALDAIAAAAVSTGLDAGAVRKTIASAQRTVSAQATDSKAG